MLWEAQEALKVPLSALFRRGADLHVFVIEQGFARERPVEIGQRTAMEAELLKGLAEGVEVIVHPSNQVADGVKVATR